ncbi:hypothetical protein JYK21_07270 [Ralstonia pickettii]|nr:hypothetical protein [Ralstonia pickettii]
MKLNANFDVNTLHLDKTVSEFKKVAYTQEMKGIKKYGKPLDPMDNYDWLKMALEEQVDGTKYLVAEMEKRRFVVGRLKKLIPNDLEDFVEIMMLLDELEGTE